MALPEEHVVLGGTASRRLTIVKHLRDEEEE